MLRKVVLVMVVIGSQWILRAGAPSAAPDDLTVKLGKRVSNYNLAGVNFIDALIRVSKDFQIPMGITWVRTPAALAETPLVSTDATVEEIIESIARTQPGYRVEIAKGMVHVFPTGLIPDQQNFLKLNIKSFEVHSEVEVAFWKLHMLITPRTAGSYQVSIAGPGDEPKIDVEMKDSTVQAVLDELAMDSTRKIWVVTFTDDARLTAQGLRQTASLWNDKVGRDDGQPAWDSLRWSDPPPNPGSARK